MMTRLAEWHYAIFKDSCAYSNACARTIQLNDLGTRGVAVFNREGAGSRSHGRRFEHNIDLALTHGPHGGATIVAGRIIGRCFNAGNCQIFRAIVEQVDLIRESLPQGYVSEEAGGCNERTGSRVEEKWRQGRLREIEQVQHVVGLRVPLGKRRKVEARLNELEHGGELKDFVRNEPALRVRGDYQYPTPSAKAVDVDRCGRWHMVIDAAEVIPNDKDHGAVP